MDNLNNIPNVGNWGDAASRLNDNFNKIKQAVTTVENTSKNNKGYFTSLSALNTAFPSPKDGQTAYVYDEASSTKYYIYNAINGAWVASSVEAPSVGVDLEGYTKTGGSTKTTKEVEDDLAQLESDVEQLAYVKIKNEVVNGNFENGLIEPFYKNDGYEGTSTLTINSSAPISGNYDIRLTITTPATSAGRPFLVGLERAANIGDKIYLHFDAKILSGIPSIDGISNGVNSSAAYRGDVINGRNTRVINVRGTGNSLGRICFNSTTAWDMQMDNFIRINLTESFGAGNEPTEEEMNLLISNLGIDYFEGEITIPAQKIMQWQKELIVSKIKSQAIQILKQEDSNLIFQGFAKPSDDTPSAKLNHTYFVVESGTVFGVEATEGQVLVGNGIEFEVRTINEKASINDVLTLSNRGGIYVKGIFPAPPPLKVGECYLHKNNFNVYIQGETSRDVLEINIGDVIDVKGVRYVKTVDGWDVLKNAKDKLEYENNGIYAYEDGVVTREDFNWGCGSINVKKGDIFSIKGKGGDRARLWIYQDSEGNDIDVAPSKADWLDIPYSFICTHDGVIYYNLHLTYASTSEVYCTAKTPEKLETNKISIKAIALSRHHLDSYNPGDMYFSTQYGKVFENKDGESVDITETVIDRDYDIYNQEDNTTYKYRNGWLRVKGGSPSMSHFKIDHEMKDVSSIISDFTFDGQTMPQVYSKYDELVSLYPDYVSRVDAAELAGITYPRYANGVAAGDTDYLETPEYKTYLYKFIDNNTIVGNDKYHQKFKIFIVAAVHGQERVSSITTYLFAKQLCEALDSNFFHLRNSFDVYIMPCTNGYGLLHNQRNNANGVNINRNYPTRHWKLQELGTEYGGETPGSEFETQLVVALTDIIKPHVPMDWHNYGSRPRQFYMTPQSEINAKIGYKALADCSYAFIKNLPQYFGEKFQLFMESSRAILPSHPISPVGSSTDFWYYERNNHFGCTYEVANAINFWDGEYFVEQKDKFGNDTMSVAEYTIRTIILRIAEYIVSSDVNSVCNWTHKEES